MSHLKTKNVLNFSKYKKVKGVNKNFVSKISHNEYNDVLLNKKYLRYSMNTIQSKNHKIGFYEITKISLFCFNDKKDIVDDRMDISAVHDHISTTSS